MSSILNSIGFARIRPVVYWATTLIIVTESVVGGVWDIARTEYIRDVLEQQLGFPTYLAIIIGVCKIPGAVALIVPRFPRVKEWAYAGIVFIYTGAVASHLSVGDIAGAIGPLGFTTITLISWWTRPTTRRDLVPDTTGFGRPHLVEPGKAAGYGYGSTTGVIGFVLVAGGLADLSQRPETAAGMVTLGYPLYFVSILGAWKLLGAVAIFAPGFPRLKEWAYAGAFFNFAGAATSHLIMGSAAIHVMWTSLFAVGTLASWWLRPQSRTLALPKPGPRPSQTTTRPGVGAR